MKKFILILLISCNLGMEYIFSQTNLTSEEQKILNAFGDNGYYYYHSKDDTVIHAYGKENYIEFKKYYLKKILLQQTEFQKDKILTLSIMK